MQVFDGVFNSGCQVVDVEIQLVNDWAPVLSLALNRSDNMSYMARIEEITSQTINITLGSVLTDSDITNSLHREVVNVSVMWPSRRQTEVSGSHLDILLAKRVSQTLVRAG